MWTDALSVDLKVKFLASPNVDGWLDEWPFSLKTVMWTDSLYKKPVLEG